MPPEVGAGLEYLIAHVGQEGTSESGHVARTLAAMVAPLERAIWERIKPPSS